MEKTKHTPGPWAIYSHYQGISITDKTKSPAEICSLLPTEADDWSAMANARLIAAAPEMLNKLKEVVVAIDGHGPCSYCFGSKDRGHEDSCLITEIKDTIAKAEGRKGE